MSRAATTHLPPVMAISHLTVLTASTGICSRPSFVLQLLQGTSGLCRKITDGCEIFRLTSRHQMDATAGSSTNTSVAQQPFLVLYLVVLSILPVHDRCHSMVSPVLLTVLDCYACGQSPCPPIHCPGCAAAPPSQQLAETCRSQAGPGLVA